MSYLTGVAQREMLDTNISAHFHLDSIECMLTSHITQLAYFHKQKSFKKAYILGAYYHALGCLKRCCSRPRRQKNKERTSVQVADLLWRKKWKISFSDCWRKHVRENESRAKRSHNLCKLYRQNRQNWLVLLHEISLAKIIKRRSSIEYACVGEYGRMDILRSIQKGGRRKMQCFDLLKSVHTKTLPSDLHGWYHH